jgi:NTE family protein
MLFHVGALWRLNELGILKGLKRIASVSGGSIINGRLAHSWRSLDFRDGVATAFDREVVEPIRRLASRTIDWQAVLTGWLTLLPIANALADIYDKHLFHGMTLRELPDDEAGDGPRFVFNATSMQTGVLFRFSRDHAGDYFIGRIDKPDFPLSHAVAASSAFPPMLSPVVLDLPPGAVVKGTGKDLSVHPYTSRVVLTDGGVYDNLGLEAIYRRYRRILVSDAGAVLPHEPVPSHGWLKQLGRSVDIQGAQVRDLRVRQLLSAFETPETDADLWRRGAYWGSGGNIAHFSTPGALSARPRAPVVSRRSLRGWPLSMRRPKSASINWGYAICGRVCTAVGNPGAKPPADSRTRRPASDGRPRDALTSVASGPYMERARVRRAQPRAGPGSQCHVFRGAGCPTSTARPTASPPSPR